MLLHGNSYNVLYSKVGLAKLILNCFSVFCSFILVCCSYSRILPEVILCTSQLDKVQFTIAQSDWFEIEQSRVIKKKKERKRNHFRYNNATFNNANPCQLREEYLLLLFKMYVFNSQSFIFICSVPSACNCAHSTSAILGAWRWTYRKYAWKCIVCVIPLSLLAQDDIDSEADLNASKLLTVIIHDSPN